MTKYSAPWLGFYTIFGVTKKLHQIDYVNIARSRFQKRETWWLFLLEIRITNTWMYTISIRDKEQYIVLQYIVQYIAIYCKIYWLVDWSNIPSIVFLLKELTILLQYIAINIMIVI